MLEQYELTSFGAKGMSGKVKREMVVGLQYFTIAFIAEIAGFIGWMNGFNRRGIMFDLSTAFWQHEVSRLSIWLPVFLTLCAVRILVVIVANLFAPGTGHVPES
jgi:hypothetical protein